MPAVVINARNFQSNMKRIQGQVARQLGLAILAGGDRLVELTRPDVPRRDGDLEQGDEVSLNSDGFNYALGSVQYNSYAPHNGFNYAMIQDKRPYKHKKGSQYYLTGNVVGGKNVVINMMAQSMREVL